MQRYSRTDCLFPTANVRSCGASKKVGQWTPAEERGLGACLGVPVCRLRQICENMGENLCNLVQSSATEYVQLSV